MEINGRQNSPDFVPLNLVSYISFCLLFQLRDVLMAKADLFPWLEMVCQFRTGPVGLILLPDGPGSPMYSQNRVCKSSFPGRSQWGSISQPLETSSTNLWKHFAGKKLSSLIQSACFQSLSSVLTPEVTLVHRLSCSGWPTAWRTFSRDALAWEG